MKISTERELGRDEVVALYGSVGWSGYVKDPEELVRGIAGSHTVLTAREDDGRLIGLARTISDGATVCYLQDILIHPDAQRRGLGRAFMTDLLERYRHCRFFVLSTDHPEAEDAKKSHPFYRSLGLVLHEEQGMAAFARPITRG